MSQQEVEDMFLECLLVNPRILRFYSPMILIFKGQCGSKVDLRRGGELQGYEFLESPIEFRFVRAGVPISDWCPALPRYISLLQPVVADLGVRTRGLDATDLAIETRGITGIFTLLVWPRE